MIEITDLRFSLNNTLILNNFNMTLNDGEIIGIIGRAGTGKSVFLKILAGILKNFEGEILYNSRPLSSFTRNEINKDISYLNYKRPDNPDDTIYDFTLLSRIPHKSLFKPFSEYDLQVTEEYLRAFNLIRHRDKVLGQLSDSNLKKTLLAHTFAREASLLLMDNPTGETDIEASSLLRKNLIKYVIDGDRIAIIASNDLNFIFQTADRIIILKNGSVAVDMLPHNIDSDLIKELFGIEVIMSRNIYNGRPEIHFFPDNS